MIREHPRFQKTAIIFISAIHLTESDYLRGYEAGAVDYLSVPVVPELLRAKVRVFAELFRKTRDLQQLNDELERRVAERTEALALSADRLRQSEQGRGLALVAGNMGSWDFDLVSGAWFWDEGQSRIFGVDHATFVPDSWTRCARASIPKTWKSIRNALTGLSPDNATCECEFRIVRPNGEIRWCTAVAVASPSMPQGKPVRFSGVTTDITERKEAENRQALLAREVDHRAKNTLAVVQAIVRMAKRDTIEDYMKVGRRSHRRPGADPRTAVAVAMGRRRHPAPGRDELAPYHGEDASASRGAGPRWCWCPNRPSWWRWRCTNWPPTRPNMARCRSRPARSMSVGRPLEER